MQPMYIVMLPQKSGHTVKPQEEKVHTPAGLRNQLTNDVFFGCKRFQCNRTGFGSLLTCSGKALTYLSRDHKVI